MNHPRSPQALRTFAYNPTAAEVAAFASTEDVTVASSDVIRAANTDPTFAAMCDGRIDRAYVNMVAQHAQNIARERMLRERETCDVVEAVWAGFEPSPYGPQGVLS